MVIWLNRKKPTIEIAKNEAWQTAFFTDFICLTTRIIATVFRSFVTNVLFLFCCYVTLHSQHMHSWSGNNKKNQIQHFSFASIYFTLQSIIHLFFWKLSFQSFFVSKLGTIKCEHYCSNNILLSTWTMPSFISPTKTLLLKQNEKMLQGFFLSQKKKRKYFFFAD